MIYKVVSELERHQSKLFLYIKQHELYTSRVNNLSSKAMCAIRLSISFARDSQIAHRTHSLDLVIKKDCDCLFSQDRNYFGI